MSGPASWDLAATLPGFEPRMVPAISAGLFWDPAAATGLGTAGFTWPEGGGHSSADEVQATTSKQGSRITANGSTQFKFLFASDQRFKTAGNYTAGWTGATYLGIWHRISLGGSSNSGITTIWAHNAANPGLRWRFFHTGGVTNTYSLSVSADGAAAQTDIWACPTDALWYFVELLYTPSVGVDCYFDLALQTHSTTAINSASLANPATALGIGGSTAAAVNTNDHEIGMSYYGNGLPSLFHRQRAYAHRAPKAVGFV